MTNLARGTVAITTVVMMAIDIGESRCIPGTVFVR
jgi:hypothetical protein